MPSSDFDKMKAIACAQLQKLASAGVRICATLYCLATAMTSRCQDMDSSSLHSPYGYYNACISSSLYPGELDGLFLDLHGAIGVAGHGPTGDAEAELVEALVAVAGTHCLVGASFDLHGNISERLLKGLDMLSAYKTMPHVDMVNTLTTVNVN